MKMRRFIILGGVIVTLIVTLTGCDTKESEVKKIEKEADVASINYAENDSEKKVEEIDNSKDEKKEKMSSNNEEQKNTNQENTKNDEVYDVKYIDMEGENGYYIIVFGYSRTDSQKVWEYKSKVDTTGAQYAAVEFIKHDSENGIVVLRELDTIKVLDDQTGKEIWTFNGFKGWGTTGTVDYLGNIYLFSKFPAKLYVIDKNGKLKKTINISEMEEFKDEYFPDGVELELNLEYGKEGVVYTVYTVVEPDEENNRQIEYNKCLTIDTIKEKVTIETTGERVVNYID